MLAASPSPPCTLLAARKLMNKYFRFQAVPSPLPTPETCTRAVPIANQSLRSAVGLGAWKKLPNREKPSGRGLEHGGKPSCEWGRSRALRSRFSCTTELSAPAEMSISSEHKPLGKQVTGSLHTVSKARAPGHSFLLWDQSIPFGLH